jgi:hypothetical protein
MRAREFTVFEQRSAYGGKTKRRISAIVKVRGIIVHGQDRV